MSSKSATRGYSTLTLSTVSHTETEIFSSEYTSKDKITRLMISSIRTWIETVTSVPELIRTGDPPDCDPPCDRKNCTISAAIVKLNYWPVSTVSGYANLTVTPNATEPVTAVVNGTTFTSPTVYLSYEGVSAIDGCGKPLGRSYPGAVLSLSPNDVTSIDMPHYPASTFNFANLNKPYPPEVLWQMCWPAPIDHCELGPDDTYNPKLVVPKEVRALDPAWKNCDLDWLGSYDPPRILVPAQALVPSTSADDVKPTSSIAMPAQTARSQGAASTTTVDIEIVLSTALTSFTKSHVSNGIPAKPLTSESPSAVNPPNQSPPGEPSDPKATIKTTPAASSPINEVTSEHPLAQHQQSPADAMSAPDSLVREPSAKDRPVVSSVVQENPAKSTPAKDPSADNSAIRNPSTKPELSQSQSVEDPLTTNPSEHNPSAQTTSAIYLPANDPPADDPSSNLPANNPSAKKSPDPSAKTFPGEAVSVTSKFTGDKSATHSVENSHINIPKIVSPAITVGSQVFTADLASHYVIGSQILAPGGEITVSGTPISMPPIRLPAEASPLSLPVIVIVSRSFTAKSISQNIIDSQTLNPGGQITVSGTPISATTLPAAVTITHPTLPPLVIASKTYSPNSESQYLIASQTLTPNGNIVVSGTTIFLLPSASAFVNGSTTEPLPKSFGLPPIKSGSKVYTAISTSTYIIRGQKLTPGGQITVDGTPISAALDASAVAIGSSTESSVAASSKIGLGWLIMEGFRFGNLGSNSGGSDNGDENTAGRATTGVSGGPPGSSTVTSVSGTSGTSVTSTPATNTTHTTAVFAEGARWRWSRTCIGFGAALSTILSTFS